MSGIEITSRLNDSIIARTHTRGDCYLAIRKAHANVALGLRAVDRNWGMGLIQEAIEAYKNEYYSHALANVFYAQA